MRKEVEVMVVDDEPIVCERLQSYLEKRGMAVEIFHESRKALERLKEKAFDVVVTDMKMEGPFGMDVLLAIKELECDSEVIIITGYGSSETVREAEAVGAFEYIDKPFRMSDMHDLVRRAAKKARGR